MLREEQIDLRRQRAKAARLVIRNLTKKKVYSDYEVSNPDSGGRYTVSVRGFDTGDNACTCPDFKANTLGTCKHIEAVLDALKDDLPAHLRKKKATVVRPEVYLHYGDPLRLGLHLPPRHSDKLGAVAKRFFDDKLLWSGRGRFEEFVPAVEAVPEEVTVLSDAMDFLAKEADRADLLRKEQEWLAALEAGTFAGPLLTVPLYDFQFRGAAFLACRGRSILGDDMGLGKTVQTLAAVELLARERNIGRVLVVAPASVKYQWETEIKRFTGRAVQVIDGDPAARDAQYAVPTFYRLVNYEQVVRDREAINAWKPDVIVLDEAQRIKNWESKTSRAVKKLDSKYAMVLTGTPLENRLEELYSIVQFVDERRFGPAFQFLNDHRREDADGHLVGYRNLDQIRDKLAPIFLRRTRAEVLTQLPERTDSDRFVELRPEQAVAYAEQRAALARLVGKGYLSDLDRKRVLACLANLRLICDSLYLFDKASHVSPKLDEFAELVPELLADGDHKLVVFSQWEGMTALAAGVLDKLDVGYASLHGGLSGKDRKAALQQFATDPDCRVFLSTDAGGVGLNLQVADTVVNLELPWNPAVLEQRIARVHRMGQKRPVRVVNFVTRGTVEERVLQTLKAKQELFTELFEGDEDEIAFTGPGAGRFLAAVQQLLKDAPADPPAPPPTTLAPAGLWRAAAELVESLAVLPGQPPDVAVAARLRTGLTALLLRLAEPAR